MDTPEMPPQGGIRGQPDQTSQQLRQLPLMQRSSSSPLSSSGMFVRISEAEETHFGPLVFTVLSFPSLPKGHDHW